MRITLVIAALAALLIPAALTAGPKAPPLTNPLTTTLDGGGNDITHVRYFVGIDTDLDAMHTREAFVSGSLKAAHVNLTVGDGFVNVTAGTASPVGLGTPGLYVQQTGPGTVALWVKTGPTASGWTQISP